MNTKEHAALKRLAKRLSAVRATLSKDERVLLDRMILGEVEAHRIATAGKSKRAVHAAEVQAHRATTNAALGAKRAARASEVALHRMTDAAQTPKRVTRATAASAASAATLLQFDATTGGYRVTDAATI